jgi:hypothetical protein
LFPSLDRFASSKVLGQCLASSETPKPARSSNADSENLQHFHDVASSQIEEIMSASKRLTPRDASAEACPFCLTIPAQSQRGFASHVGKHQQEISLAALPNLEDSGEDGSSDESDGDDDHWDAASDTEEDENDGANSDERSLDSDGSGRTITSLTRKTGIERRESISSKQEEEDPEDHGSHQSPAVSSISTTKKAFLTIQPPLADEEWFERMSITQEGESSTLFAREFLDALLASEQDLASTPDQRTSSQYKQSSLLDRKSSQISMPLTWGPQNRLVFTVKDFQKSVEKCTGLLISRPSSPAPDKLPLLLSKFTDEMGFLATLARNLKSSSSMLDKLNIDKAIETLAICRTQLRRLQKFLESMDLTLEKLQKRGRRQSLGLRQIFGRQTPAESLDIPKGENILVQLKHGAATLTKVLASMGDDSAVATPMTGTLDNPQTVTPRFTVSHDGIVRLTSPNQTEQMDITPKSEPYAVYAVYASRFLEAIRSNDLTAINRLLGAGIDINAKLTPDGNALQIAAAHGHQGVLQLLLDRGANVNADVGLNGPPLQAAVTSRDESNVKLLLDHGSSVNARGGYGSALRAAASLNLLAIVRLLVEYGATIEDEDLPYFMALREARGNQMTAMDALLSGFDGVSTPQVNAGSNVPIAPPEGISKRNFLSDDDEDDVEYPCKGCGDIVSSTILWPKYVF